MVSYYDAFPPIPTGVVSCYINAVEMTTYIDIIFYVFIVLLKYLPLSYQTSKLKAQSQTQRRRSFLLNQ